MRPSTLKAVHESSKSASLESIGLLGRPELPKVRIRKERRTGI